MTQSQQTWERKLMKKTPKRKTSVYLDKENLETIKGFKEKYNLSVNRTINMCLTKYLPEMLVWIWCHEWTNLRWPLDLSRPRWVEGQILWLVGWPSPWTSSPKGYCRPECWSWRQTSFQDPWCCIDQSKRHRWTRPLCDCWKSRECWRINPERPNYPLQVGFP